MNHTQTPSSIIWIFHWNLNIHVSTHKPLTVTHDPELPHNMFHPPLFWPQTRKTAGSVEKLASAEALCYCTIITYTHCRKNISDYLIALDPECLWDVHLCFLSLIQVDNKWTKSAGFWFVVSFFSQLKKTVEELNDALATKEEISQRCRELDMQVGFMQACNPPCFN